MKIGYARVSTKTQNTDLQVEQLKALGCDKIYTEQYSGKDADRTQLKAMLDFARDGDVIHVMKVDRLARNTRDALEIADHLKDKNVGLVFQDLNGVDINSDVGRVIYTTIAAFAEMERKRIIQRANEGREKAKADGVVFGRKTNTVLHDQIIELNEQGVPKAHIAKQLNCGRATVYRALGK